MNVSLSSRSLSRLINNRLRLKHMELFEQVCEKRSLRKASDACGITQPAATKLIQELEGIFGTALFHRDRQGMRPTLHGDLVRRHLAVLTADIQNLQSELEVFAAGGAGRVRLGAIPSVASELLARSVIMSLQARPGVQISLREGTTAELLSALRQAEFDLVFSRVMEEPAHPQFHSVVVYDEPFAVVARADHPLANAARIDWRKLSQAQWVLPEAGTPMLDLINGVFAQHSVPRPAPAVECSAPDKVRKLVTHTDLLGVLPQSGACEGEARGELAIICPSLGPNLAPISLVFRKDIEQPPAVLAFAETVHAAARELGLR